MIDIILMVFTIAVMLVLGLWAVSILLLLIGFIVFDLKNDKWW